MRDKKAWTKFLAILVLVSLAFTYAVPWVVTARTGASSSVISLAFEGIGKGMDPKGNSFNINEIKSEAVLEEALKNAGLSEELTTEEFRKLIFIKPIVGKEALNKLTEMTAVSGKTEDVGQKSSHPSQFVVGVKDIGLPSYFTTQKLEESLTKAYFSYLKSKYLVNDSSEPSYTKEELFQLDYPEMMIDLYQQADSLVRYAEGFTKTSPDFTSKETGISFADLKAQAEVIRDTEVQSTSAVVDYYILTKDANNRLKYEEIRLKRANLSLSKAQGRELAISGILAIYDNSNNYMFAAGAMAGTGIDISENVYYSELMKNYVISKNNTIEARYDVAEIQKNIAKLAAPNLTPEEYAKRVKETERLAKSSYAQIAQVKDQIKTLAMENYETNVASKTGVTKASYQINGWGNVILNFVVLGVLALVVRITVTWFRKKEYQFMDFIKAGVDKLG